MLTPAAAWAKILAHTDRLSTVEAPLHEALAHVLAEPVTADRDLPPANRSAIDGFALCAADLAGVPVTLPIVGEIAAGTAVEQSVARGTCVRVFTGSNLPPGADTVVQVEDVESSGDKATIVRLAEAGANILRRGENARAGAELVPAGRRLGPLHLGIAAAVGRATLSVVRRPTVAIIATGRELLATGEVAATHQERDANGPALASACRAEGFAVASACRVSDVLEAVVSALQAALATADVVVLSGGVSVGKYDFVPAAVAAVGAKLILHGVAMKPGKPFLFAQADARKPIFGLPGNPLSAATGLHELVLPALRRMAGHGEEACRPLLRARLCETVHSKAGRQRHVLASMAWSASGPEVSPICSQSSADLAAGARADGAIIVPAEACQLDAGALVDFRPWRGWP